MALLSVLAAAGCASVNTTPSGERQEGAGFGTETATRPDGTAASSEGAASAAKAASAGAASASPAPRSPAVGSSARSSARATAPTPPLATEAASAGSAEVWPDNSPAVVVSPVAPAGETDLWVRIRKGFALPALDTPLVAEKEKFYLQRPDYIDRMMQRGSRYLHHIVEEVEKRGLPTELALLPFVESAMNPVALSSAQASGLWQFIPSTGRVFNLSQNWWVDNRRDIVHSTRAALDYLQKIHAMHGNDWFLALASYNWGEGAVGRAIRKNAAKGRPTDYLSLDMPNETRHYVPKLMAIKNIVERASELGVALPPLPNRPYFVTIEKTRPIDLKLAAQFAGMSIDEFVALNPAHNRPVIAASKNNEIKLPADRLDAFVAAVTKHHEAKKAFATWQPYTVQPGESLEQVAQRGGVTVAELQKANGLRVGSRILPGTHLLAPQPKATGDERKVESFVAPRVYELVSHPPVYHVVTRADSLPSIARRYGVSASSIVALNGSKKFKRGATVLVRAASTQTMLTTEDGSRQVVAHRPAQEAAEQPAAAAAASPAHGEKLLVGGAAAKTKARPLRKATPVTKAHTRAAKTGPAKGPARKSMPVAALQRSGRS